MKQMAVEWLITIWATQGTLHSSDITKAKEMEKQQVVEAYGNGYEAGFTSEYCVPEQYYNKTYKTK